MCRRRFSRQGFDRASVSLALDTRASAAHGGSGRSGRMAVPWWGCLRAVALAFVVLLPGTSFAQENARAGMEAHVDPRTGGLVAEPVAPPARPLPAPVPPLAELPG